MRKISRRRAVLGGIVFSGTLRTLASSLSRENSVQSPFSGSESSATADLNPEIEKKIDELLAQMTLDEKVRQLCSMMVGTAEHPSDSPQANTLIALKEQFGADGIGFISRSIMDLDPETGTELTNLIQTAASQTRLGIPPIVDGEGLRGLRANGSTVFPTALAMAAAWDPQLLFSTAVVIAQEARSRGIHRLYAPVLNLGRDPRHGRTEETYGEDPFLAAELGVAFVRGLQSQGVIATAKHFIGNFEGDGGRDSADVEFSERSLRETYFPPFRAAIVGAGAHSVMCAYNSLNAVPCVAHTWLLTHVLRHEWKFDGVVMSDWGGLARSLTDLRSAAGPGPAAVNAITAGMDVESPRLDFFNDQLAREVHEGRCQEDVIDESVRRVLRLKFEFGLFENRRNDPGRAQQLSASAEHRRTALLLARRSIVLLRNENSVLPISPAVKTIAVIGPNADRVQVGGYAPRQFRARSPLEALCARFAPRVNVRFAQGCELTGNSKSGFNSARNAAIDSDLILLFLGNSSETSGETRDRADLDLPGMQEELIHFLAVLNKPIIVVLISGGPVTMMHWIDKVQGVVMAWYGGTEGATALSEVLVGDANPSGHLPISFPRFTGQLPMPYDQRPAGRPSSVLEVPGEPANPRYQPLFPFGFGLSYTSFVYSGLSITPQRISKHGSLRVTLTVRNSGDRPGEDVVQLYLSCPPSLVTRPGRRLIGFQRISLSAHENKQVSFTLGSSELSSLNEQLQPDLIAGAYSLLAGHNCSNGIRSTFEVA